MTLAKDTTPNLRLVAARDRRTQEQVAEELCALARQRGQPVGINAKQVSKWERGVQQPGRYSRELLIAYYGQSAEALGLDPPTGEQAMSGVAGALTLDDMHRRTFLQGGLALVGVGLTGGEPWERLSFALRRPGLVDLETVDHLERMTIALEELEAQISPKALLGAVSGHLDTISNLLQGSPPERLHRRLCSLAAETAGLAGWLVWDLELPNAAERYFQAGLEAARDASDRAIGAYLVGSAACQPSYRERPAARLRQLDGHTYGFSQNDATPATRAWLASLEAEAHALASDLPATLRALDHAEVAITAPQPEGIARPRVAFFDSSRLIGERGVALSRLGQATGAQEALRPALQTLPATAVKTRPRLLTALATAHIQTGDLDEACRLGTEALRIAVAQGVAPNLGDCQQLRRRLEPWQDATPVREFDEQLRLAG